MKHQGEIAKILRFMLFTKFESFAKNLFNLILLRYIQHHAYICIAASMPRYYACLQFQFLNLEHDLTYAIKKFFRNCCKLVGGCRLIISHAAYSFARVACTSILEIRGFLCVTHKRQIRRRRPTTVGIGVLSETLPSSRKNISMNR